MWYSTTVCTDHYNRPVGRIAYTIPDELHARAKVAAAKAGITLKAWLERAIDQQAAAEEADEQRRRR